MRDIHREQIQTLERSILNLQMEYNNLKANFFILKNALERIKAENLSAIDCENVARLALTEVKDFRSAI